MRYLLALCIICMSSIPAIAQDIEDWSFTWTVVESGKASFKITKTSEALYCSVGVRYDSVRASPADAEAIGQVFKGAKATIDELKAKGGEASRDFEAGEFKISISHHPTRGSSVYLRRADSITSGVLLTVRQCSDLSGDLVNAKRLAGKVDKAINP